MTSSQIRQLRIRLKLSQKELAERLMVRRATINRWESGKSAPQKVHLKQLERLMTSANGDE